MCICNETESSALSLSCYMKTCSIVVYVSHFIIALSVVLVKLTLTVGGSEHGFGFIFNLSFKQVFDDLK